MIVAQDGSSADKSFLIAFRGEADTEGPFMLPKRRRGPTPGAETAERVVVTPFRRATTILVDGSTLLSPSIILDTAVSRLLAEAREERFEDGMETPFSRGLTEIVTTYAQSAIESLDYFLLHGRAGDEVVGEAMRWLGLMDHLPTRERRRKLLERGLRSLSASVRDGACLGLSYLEDPRALPALERALARETSDLVRDAMELTAKDLRDSLPRRRLEIA